MPVPTIRQKNVASDLVEVMKNKESITGHDLIARNGYGTGLQHQPSRVLESVGVKQALKDYGFTEDNAKKVVARILLSNKSKDENKLKASEQIFKVHGSYAPEKHLNLNIDSPLKELSIEELEQMAYNKAETKENEAPQAP